MNTPAGHSGANCQPEDRGAQTDEPCAELRIASSDSALRATLLEPACRYTSNQRTAGQGIAEHIASLDTEVVRPDELGSELGALGTVVAAAYTINRLLRLAPIQARFPLQQRVAACLLGCRRHALRLKR